MHCSTTNRIGLSFSHEEHVLPSTVQTIRLKHRLLQKESQSHQLKKDGFLSIRQIAEKLDVDNHWVYDRIHNGRIKTNKMKAYLFPNNYEVLKLLIN